MQANLRAFGSSSRRHLFLSLEMVVLYLAVVSLLVWLIARGNASFSYALDDPYIHLALAQHLRHGFYGLNPGEYTSPSSSIVWPFLLVPFADGPLRQWFPLILNVIPGVMLCCLVASFVPAWHRQVATAVGIWAWIALGPLLVFAADLPSLAHIGMEHSLQLLTVGICAFAVVEAYAGRKIPVWMLAAAACAPAIRYEDLIFTLVVVAACWLGGQRRAAMLTGIVALLPILAFGLFLHWHGLQFFPNSILAKSGVFTPRRTVIPGAPLLNRVVLLAATNIVHYVIDPDRWALTFFAGLLLWLALRKGQDHL